MKTKTLRQLAGAAALLLTTTLAFAACNPTYQTHGKISECSGSIGSGQKIDRITWTCCDEEHRCTNGTAKRFYRTADIFSNSITGVPCWLNASDGYDTEHPCCKPKAIEPGDDPLP
jgi:hypothetical protein